MNVIDPKILDNLANRLAAALPTGIKEMKQDVEKNCIQFQGLFSSVPARSVAQSLTICV